MHIFTHQNVFLRVSPCSYGKVAFSRVAKMTVMAILHGFDIVHDFALWIFFLCDFTRKCTPVYALFTLICGTCTRGGTPGAYPCHDTCCGTPDGPPPPLRVMVAQPAHVTQVTQVPLILVHESLCTVPRHNPSSRPMTQHSPSPPPPLHPPMLGKLPWSRRTIWKSSI